ncbi:hypothetical protein ACFFIY_02280 [Bhargavaea ullalensis]|uniref:Uncharacterized protein n=1 Tax=Bhargavaea ullalensis TaxID=1265685 RepID=A0ABV2GBB3_9BACL
MKKFLRKDPGELVHTVFEVMELDKNQKRNKENKPGSTKDREEYGYGYDISVDDLGVIGQNDAAKKQNRSGGSDKKKDGLSHEEWLRADDPDSG